MQPLKDLLANKIIIDGTEHQFSEDMVYGNQSPPAVDLVIREEVCSSGSATNSIFFRYEGRTIQLE